MKHFQSVVCKGNLLIEEQLKQLSLILSFTERHSNNQNSQVHDEPTASEEANGKASHVLVSSFSPSVKQDAYSVLNVFKGR